MKNECFFRKILYLSCVISALIVQNGCYSLRNTIPQQPPLFVKCSTEEPNTKKYAPSKKKFFLSLDPTIRKAYLEYVKTGKATTISTPDFLQFPYGLNEPQVYCQPLHTCDISLQKGERITGIHAGDTARWKYEVASSGIGNEAQPHFIFKPTAYDISTNVIITTTRRTYHLNLVSKHKDCITQICFWYPDDLESAWNMINQEFQLKSEEENQTEAESSKFNLNCLNFNYRISKSLFVPAPNWTPVRVFNDGTHVYIEMPTNMRTSDAPALFVVKNDGQPALVNYRVKNNYYIVDELFQQATLVTGVGSSQQRITINYRSQR